MNSMTANPILTAEAVNDLLERESPVLERLDGVVRQLKQDTGVDVCTLYRIERRSGDLILQATEGLARENIGEVALRHGEGLSGLVAVSRKPLAVRDGPSHPNFRYVPGLNEEVFHSFLGVPVISGRESIGVLVVQTVRPRDFTREEIALLNSVSRLIAPVASPVFRRLERENGRQETTDEVQTIVGRSLAPGCFLGPPLPMVEGFRLEAVFTPASRGAKEELEHLHRAVDAVREDLIAEAQAIGGSDAPAILMAHQTILDDPSITKEIKELVEKGSSAAEAVRLTALHWIKVLEGARDAAFAARASDLRDVAHRVLRALGIEPMTHLIGNRRVVALARLMLPGDIIHLGPSRLGAMILTEQGIHSHTAILARSFKIPTVQVEEAKLGRIREAERVMVDGSEGLILLDPDEETARRYFTRAQRIMSLPGADAFDLRREAATRDGVAIQIGLNAGFETDFEAIDDFNPSDIGLYRTELAFMSHRRLPGLKAQLAHYQKVMKLAGGRRLTFRTFDFGGDKIPAAVHFDREENPMMGFRSTRYMLGNEEIFGTQLRALLLASQYGSMGILLPMISTPEEINLALDEINLIKNELREDGSKFDPQVPIGAMLEVPSMAFMIERLADSVDFFCIGTNDLIQYLMAADRSNPRVSRLYQWHHPAVLAVLRHILRECRRVEKPVTLCGEMAGQSWAAMVLVGMGYRHLSMDAHAIPHVKWVLSQLSSHQLRRLAESALGAGSATEVVEIFYRELPELADQRPDLRTMLANSLERLRMNSQW